MVQGGQDIYPFGLFGWLHSPVRVGENCTFLCCLFSLGLVVHLVYRFKTNRWRQSWLDFVVVEENGEMKTKRIGVFYYLAVILNIILSLAVSQVLPGVW